MGLNLYAFVLVFCYLSFSTVFASSYYADLLANTQTAMTAPAMNTSTDALGVWDFLRPVIEFFNGLLGAVVWIYNALSDTILALFILPFLNGGVVWGLLNGIMMIVGVYLIIDVIHGLI